MEIDTFHVLRRKSLQKNSFHEYSMQYKYFEMAFFSIFCLTNDIACWTLWLSIPIVWTNTPNILNKSFRAKISLFLKLLTWQKLNHRFYLFQSTRNLDAFHCKRFLWFFLLIKLLFDAKEKRNIFYEDIIFQWNVEWIKQKKNWIIIETPHQK